MQLTTLLTTTALFLGLAVAFPTEIVSPEQLEHAGLNVPRQEHGDRVCVLGGISCSYSDGTRCAKPCQTGPICSCPDGHWDKGSYHTGYSGANCIPVSTALGRHLC